MKLNSKPIIGIIPTINYDDIDPFMDKTSFVNMYSEQIIKSGGIPIGILNNNDISGYLSICDGYLWPGGNKILFEFFPILEDAIKNHKPLLGICLGAQAISTALNVLEDRNSETSKTIKEIYESYKETNPYLKKLEDGNIHMHIVTKEEDSINKARHSIKIEKNSLLYEIVKKETLNVVSLHGMQIARVPKNICISAKAEDEVIEAIEYKENGALILGILFHPEIESKSPLFDWLISSCHKQCRKILRRRIKYARNSRS